MTSSLDLVIHGVKRLGHSKEKCSYSESDQTPELSGLLDGLSEEDEDLQGLTTEAWAGYVAAEAKGLEIIARLLENRRTRVEAAVQTIKADV